MSGSLPGPTVPSATAAAGPGFLTADTGPGGRRHPVRQTLIYALGSMTECQRIVVGPGSQLALRFEPSTLAITPGDSAWSPGRTRPTVPPWSSPTPRPSSPCTARSIGSRAAPGRRGCGLRATHGECEHRPGPRGAAGGPLLPGAAQRPEAAVVARKTAEHVLYKHQSLAAMAVEATGHSVHDAEWEAHRDRGAAGLGAHPSRPARPADLAAAAPHERRPERGTVAVAGAGAHPSPVSYTAAGADLAQQWQAALARALAQRPAGVTGWCCRSKSRATRPAGGRAAATLDLLLETGAAGGALSLDFDGTHSQVQDVPVPSPPLTPVVHPVREHQTC